MSTDDVMHARMPPVIVLIGCGPKKRSEARRKDSTAV